MATNLLKISNVKFQENPSSGCHHDTGRPRDLHEATSFFSPAQVSKNPRFVSRIHLTEFRTNVTILKFVSNVTHRFQDLG